MLRLTPALALPQVSKELETIIYLQTIKELHFINGRGNISQFLTLTRRGRHNLTFSGETPRLAVVLDAGGWGVGMQGCIDAVIVGGGGVGRVWRSHSDISSNGRTRPLQPGCYRDIRQCITSHEEHQHPALHLPSTSTDIYWFDLCACEILIIGCDYPPRS